MTGPERIVLCPNCGKRTPYVASNAFRPFCSERCRLIDFGAWAGESHVIPGEELPPGVVTDESDDSESFI